MLKNLLIVAGAAMVLTGCGSTTATDGNRAAANNANSSSVSKPANPANPDVVSSHSATKPDAVSSSAPSDQKSSPMQQGIDVKDLNAKIDAAKKALEAKPKDKAAETALAEAYFDRAFALTKAAQYRAALGDFRKGLKLNPKNDEARKMHDEIIDIFKSMGREPPKEGEEPEPIGKN